MNSMPAVQDTLQSVAEHLNALEASKRGADANSSRSTYLTKLWSLILSSSAKQKEDLLKLWPPARLLALLEEGGQRDSRVSYAAAGCLAALSRHPKWLAELTATAATTARVVSGCVLLLSGAHDRSRLPAVQLLQALGGCPMQVPRLAPALQPLLSLLAATGGPGWAGGRQLLSAAACVLAALLAPSECDSVEQQQARRCSCLSSGVVGPLLTLLQGSSGGAVLLPAAACLRYLALAPGAAEVMAGDPAVSSQLLQLLSGGPTATPAVRAYVSGILWELGAAAAAAEALIAAGAVAALLQVVQDMACGVGGATLGKGKGKKGKGKKAAGAKKAAGTGAGAAPGAKQGAKDGKTAAAAAAAGALSSSLPGGGVSGGTVQAPGFVLLQDPQAAAEVALCNATGALHHLSFLDAAKLQLGASQQLSLLVRLAGCTQGQTYDNVVGVLWNVGLLDVNQPLLAAAGAPSHLVRPIPARWTTTLSVSAATAAASAAAATAATAAASKAQAASTGTPAAPAGGCVRQTALRFVR